ncbi:MAG: hypothetical protein WDM96_18745 [Lacunisphaera sp.]
MPEAATLEAATVHVINHLPIQRRVLLRCGAHSSSLLLVPGQEADLRVEIAPGQPCFEIITETDPLSVLLPGSTDSRQPGIAVTTICLEASASQG